MLAALAPAPPGNWARRSLAPPGSRGAATESSPRREPWVSERKIPSPGRGERRCAQGIGQTSAAPAGADPQTQTHPRLTPWATFCRAAGAGAAGHNWCEAVCHWARASTKLTRLVFFCPRAIATAVVPSELVHLASAPFCKRQATKSSFPDDTAHINAEPLSLWSFTAAPFSTNSWTTSRWPPRAADMTGVIACIPRPFTLAPWLKSSRMRPASPDEAAWLSASLRMNPQPATPMAIAATAIPIAVMVPVRFT